MALQYRSRKLGCSYYDPQTKTLYLMQDIEESYDCELVEQRKLDGPHSNKSLSLSLSLPTCKLTHLMSFP